MGSPLRNKPYPLSRLIANRSLVRTRCHYCKLQHNYYPEDLIRIFGDADVDSLMTKMRCERDKSHGTLDVRTFVPTGSEAVGLKIRRLDAIVFRRIPVWKDEP